ncbi:hypothetical protein FG05_35098 [Fusarium graminearum]|nr:hypothetical protein FG05_35098 [Fusarium graminearum]
MNELDGIPYFLPKVSTDRSQPQGPTGFMDMFGRDSTWSSAWDNVHSGRNLHNKKRWLIKALGRNILLRGSSESENKLTTTKS